MGRGWQYKTLWETAAYEVTEFSRKKQFSTNLISRPQSANLRSRNHAAESTQLPVTWVFFLSLLSRNFDYQLSINCHRFVLYAYVMYVGIHQVRRLVFYNYQECPVPSRLASSSMALLCTGGNALGYAILGMALISCRRFHQTLSNLALIFGLRTS